MKILLSHSWSDKPLASILKTNIELDSHEVWFDIADMVEGDPIQNVIDSHLAKCDVMVLLWSKSAVTSEGVGKEIKSAQGMKKRIIPVLVDDTPLALIPELDGLLGVPAQNIEMGSFILRRALLLLMIPEEYKTSAWFGKAYGNVKDLGGYLKYVETYRLPNNKNDDGHKEYMIKLLTQLDEENTFIRENVMNKTEMDMKYMQQIISGLEGGNNTKEQLQEWLQWCRQNQNAQTDLIQKMAAFIEKDLERLNTTG
ncbi:MAG: toll/interleukin-1 receptor domain-containing protein [Flavobacteriales bacterium]